MRSAITAASRRRGRSATRTSSPGTRRPRACTSARKAGEDPTEGSAAAPSLSRGAARAAHPAASRRPREARAPSVAPAARRDARPGRRRPCPAHEPLHPLRSGRRLSVPRAGQGRRADGVRRPCARRTRTSTSSPTPRSSGSRPTPAAGRSLRWWSRLADGTEARYSGDVVVVSCGALELGAAAAAVGQRRPSERARQRVGPGRPQLHAPQQPGDDGAVEGAEPHASSRRRWRSTTGTSRARTRTTRGAASRCSARPMASSCGARRRTSWRGRRSSRPGASLDMVAHHSVDFWLSSEDLPHPDNRVSIDTTARCGSPSIGDQPGGAQAAAQEVPVDARRTSGCTRSLTSASSTSHEAWTSPPPRTRRARSGSAPIRRRRYST